MNYNKPQCQDSLETQLTCLSDLAKDSGYSANTLSRLLHVNSQPLTDVSTQSELIRCIQLANKNGYYDAADYIRYKILKLS